MNSSVTPDTLHRTAKYFMDAGRADSHESAIGMLKQFGLRIKVGPEVAHSRDHQVALLTLVNIARRTFLGGVHAEGIPRATLLAPLSDEATLDLAVEKLGGNLRSHSDEDWPVAYIGSVPESGPEPFGWRLTWEGWRGGVVPIRDQVRLAERDSAGLAPAFAAAACTSELFLFYSRDHPLAGRRSAGLSLWSPGRDWLASDETEVRIDFLPSALWLIGLGNLGQAYLWILACLPFQTRGDLRLMLQDDDRISLSNDSTSVLTNAGMVGKMKTRSIVDWLERKGFQGTLEERRFGEYSRRASREPAVALCGVDNALARTHLEKADFELVIETGLGAGTQSFRNFSLHTFPSSLSASQIWAEDSGGGSSSLIKLPAYEAVKLPGLDQCGIAQLASRTIGVPFVGLTAAALAVSELLRRIHNGPALELVSGSISALEDVETAPATSRTYGSGHLRASVEVFS
jgi:hypothetical protein